MSEMVERLAKAIDTAGKDWLSKRSSAGFEWADIPSSVFARAAIAALREPTDQMLFEGVIVQDSDDPAVQGIWRAMCDAALGETL